MLEELQTLSREELIKKWKNLFKKNSPQHARKDFLIKHIAWELQARKEGGYSNQTQKQLDKLSQAIADNEDKTDSDSKLSNEIKKNNSILEIKPGTRLIREYKGVKHEVTSLEKGFEYNNKTYKSLSAIAGEITGTSWNGKVFFGVKK